MSCKVFQGFLHCNRWKVTHWRLRCHVDEQSSIAFQHATMLMESVEKLLTFRASWSREGLRLRFQLKLHFLFRKLQTTSIENHHYQAFIEQHTWFANSQPLINRKLTAIFIKFENQLSFAAPIWIISNDDCQAGQLKAVQQPNCLPIAIHLHVDSEFQWIEIKSKVRVVVVASRTNKS